MDVYNGLGKKKKKKYYIYLFANIKSCLSHTFFVYFLIISRTFWKYSILYNTDLLLLVRQGAKDKAVAESSTSRGLEHRGNVISVSFSDLTQTAI